MNSIQSRVSIREDLLYREWYMSQRKSNSVKAGGGKELSGVGTEQTAGSPKL